jgi:hypothetical protein
MFHLGVQARFDDPATGKKTTMVSYDHSLDDMLAGAEGAGWLVDEVAEAVPDDRLLRDFPNVTRYRGCRMLAAMALSKEAPKR